MIIYKIDNILYEKNDSIIEVGDTVLRNKYEILTVVPKLLDAIQDGQWNNRDVIKVNKLEILLVDIDNVPTVDDIHNKAFMLQLQMSDNLFDFDLSSFKDGAKWMKNKILENEK